MTIVIYGNTGAATRVVGELRKLGINIAKLTVSIHGMLHSPGDVSLSWNFPLPRARYRQEHRFLPVLCSVRENCRLLLVIQFGLIASVKGYNPVAPVQHKAAVADR